MKKALVFGIIICVTGLIIACNVIDNPSQRNETNIDQEAYSELITKLEGLNHDVEIKPQTKGWLKWLLVAGCDALGAACGTAAGGPAGGVVLGALASIDAIIEIDGRVVTENPDIVEMKFDKTAVEVEFTEVASRYKEYEEIQVGENHNRIIRNLKEKYGSSIYTMEENKLVKNISTEYQSINPNSKPFNSDLLKKISPKEINRLLSNSDSIEEGLNKVSKKYPDIALDLSVLKPIMIGIQDKSDSEELIDYLDEVIKLVAKSSITNESKRIILSGTSVAVGSSQLWNEL